MNATDVAGLVGFLIGTAWWHTWLRVTIRRRESAGRSTRAHRLMAGMLWIVTGGFVAGFLWLRACVVWTPQEKQEFGMGCVYKVREGEQERGWRKDAEHAALCQCILDQLGAEREARKLVSEYRVDRPMSAELTEYFVAARKACAAHPK
jgi:hypothetical protein